MSLEQSDAAAAAHAVAPRVSLADIEAAISHIEYIIPSTAPTLTICIMTHVNGFHVVGKSAPASSENFNEELGRKFAREDAIRQLWPLMGFALRERLAAGA